MKTLFVAWQQPISREWIPVARLEHENGRFRFSYTRGVFRAQNFLPFNRMHQLDAIYESTSIFPLFANRIISKSRPEFKDYLRWLGLDTASDDPLSILALTGGIRGTDSIEIFEPPSINENTVLELSFFVRSLSHMPKEAISHIGGLNPGDKLYLMRDCQNDFDENAVALRTGSQPFFIGFCPKYYAQDLNNLLSIESTDLQATVKSVNRDAPLNMRLLCHVSAKVPLDFVPLTETDDFKCIEGDVPNEWKALSLSLDAVLEDKV